MGYKPNPEPYKWKPNEVDPMDMVPYVKKANVVLERDGVAETFVTQEEVDEAWANGWHDTNRPETADVVFVDGTEVKVDTGDGDKETITVPKPPATWARMTVDELIEFAGQLNEVCGTNIEVDIDMLKDDIRDTVKATYDLLLSGE